MLNEFVLLSPSTPACALPLFSFDVTKILLLKYNLCLIRTYSAFCRLISQLFFVSLHQETKNDQYGTENQNLRSFRACPALFPHTFAEVGLAETEVVADTQSGPSQSGHAPSAHVHTR